MHHERYTYTRFVSFLTTNSMCNLRWHNCTCNSWHSKTPCPYIHILPHYNQHIIAGMAEAKGMVRMSAEGVWLLHLIGRIYAILVMLNNRGGGITFWLAFALYLLLWASIIHYNKYIAS